MTQNKRRQWREVKWRKNKKNLQKCIASGADCIPCVNSECIDWESYLDNDRIVFILCLFLMRNKIATEKLSQCYIRIQCDRKTVAKNKESSCIRFVWQNYCNSICQSLAVNKCRDFNCAKEMMAQETTIDGRNRQTGGEMGRAFWKNCKKNKENNNK